MTNNTGFWKYAMYKLCLVYINVLGNKKLKFKKNNGKQMTLKIFCLVFVSNLGTSFLQLFCANCQKRLKAKEKISFRF